MDRIRRTRLAYIGLCVGALLGIFSLAASFGAAYGLYRAFESIESAPQPRPEDLQADAEEIWALKLLGIAGSLVSGGIIIASLIALPRKAASCDVGGA
ncbi:MAG: hypothetical protein HY721_06030 [Planctomycetes bacterium]|nr:hypothetical protein [Planctomycetota bacterium]